MSEPNPAVFLSYASQDAAAARRICETLRNAGIEVWFDQSELRGGDAWDQQIRRQIRDCALFVPIISAHTQSRLEGYFRREWRLAVDRTQDMADGKPFLVPVATDDTHDRDAHVPEAFRAVQWTRLPMGETSPAFVQRVSRLLGQGTPGSGSVASSSGPSRPLAAGRGARRGSTIVLVIAAVVAIAAGVFAFDRFMPSKGAVSTARELPPLPAAPPPTLRESSIPEKSIAVLPFVDMSEKHDQQYFSDGLAEELLDLLSKVPDLQVTARTSSFSFKGTTDDIPTIARKLSVANILEGSVRKSGRRLRITTQLVRADNGMHIWSETYDRDLEDVFKVQDEIARIVVEKLKGTLLGGAPAAARPENSKAHVLYLQAQYFRDLDTETGIDKAIESYRSALALDPTYARAWAGLSAVYTRKIANGYTNVDTGVALGRAAATKAIEFDPNMGEAYATLATFQMMADHDWSRSADTLAKGRKLDPNNAVLLLSSGVQARAMGRNEASIKYFQQSLERDPLNLLVRRYYARTLLQSNRVAEAEATIRQVLEMSPSFPAAHYELGKILLEKGQPGPALAAFQAETDPAWRSFGLPLGFHALGRTREAEAALAALLANSAGSEFQVAEAFAFMGNADKAFEWLEAADVSRDPGVTWIRGDPQLHSITGDPRYPAMLRKLKLAE